MENKELSTQEKIDYIYDTLKKQEKRELHKNIFRWWFRIFIIIYIIYFYFFWFNLLVEKIKNSLKIEVNSENILDTIKNKINLENKNY